MIDERMSDRLIKRSMFFFFGNKQNKGNTYNILIVEKAVRDAARGGQLPPKILADQKEPPGSGGAPHYYLCSPGFLTLAASLQ